MTKRKTAPRKRVKQPTVEQRLRNLELLAGKAVAQQILGATPVDPVGGHAAVLSQLLKEAEFKAETATRELKRMNDRLVGLLTSDQLDAAAIAGCTPAQYAIEWLSLQKEQFFPNHQALITPYRMGMHMPVKDVI